MLSIPELYYGWITFWGTYFIASCFFPDDSIVRPTAKIMKRNVIIRLLQNCAITAITIPLIYRVPQVIWFSTEWYGYILKYVFVLFLSETWFYYVHRLLHHKLFYRWHADHHAYIQPYALAGFYCSLVEMILVNQLSMSVPFQLVGFTVHELLLASFLVPLSVLRGHAGLHLRTDLPSWFPVWLVSNWDHDLHHRTMTCNFGLLYLLDRVHGTYKEDQH